MWGFPRSALQCPLAESLLGKVGAVSPDVCGRCLAEELHGERKHRPSMSSKHHVPRPNWKPNERLKRESSVPQKDWYWCNECEGLYFCRQSDPRGPPAGGGHNYSGSGEYKEPSKVLC
jgi:hypothetical protein